MSDQLRDILRKGVFDGMRSDAFVALSKKSFGLVMTPVPLALGLAEVNSLSDADPKIVAYLKKYIDEGQKGVRKRKGGRKKRK